MTRLCDFSLVLFLVSVASGGGTVAWPLAIALGALGLAILLTERPVARGFLAGAVALAGAHAVAGAVLPIGTNGLVSRGGAAALTTFGLAAIAWIDARPTTPAMKSESRTVRIEMVITAVLGLLLLAATPLLLLPFGVSGRGIEEWRPVLAIAFGAIQAFATASLLRDARPIRARACGAALVVVALVAIALPSTPPPLKSPHVVRYVEAP